MTFLVTGLIGISALSLSPVQQYCLVYSVYHGFTAHLESAGAGPI